MKDHLSAAWPSWLRDLAGTLAVHSQYVLSGEVRDLCLIPGDPVPKVLRVIPAVWEALRPNGYEFLLVWDPVDGLSTYPATEETAKLAVEVLGRKLDGQTAEPSLRGLRGWLRDATEKPGRRVAVVLDYASRISAEPEHLLPEERDFFRFCQKLSHVARPVVDVDIPPRPLYNPVIWVLDREQDMPAWFVAGNERVRVIPLAAPDFGQRLQAAELAVAALPEAGGLLDDEREAVVAGFAELAEGMTISGMFEVTRLARDRGLGAHQLGDALRAYKVGLLDSPWRAQYLPERIRQGETELRDRVLGQEQAITKTMDILKRSVMGLSGAHTSRQSNRPRGVLFFAGPTGVGKTELAKGLARLIFGDEKAYVRFDMSEFAAEHSQARLIGAPPGYVGFDAGGELTNAVRHRPFSLLLFDEIEKADRGILDKFLQILEDGRLTDGRGSTVHFSETVIVFTSNLGIMSVDETGHRSPNVSPAMEHDEVDRLVRVAIKDHFTSFLNRPELLNRIGEMNIVVFDFIRPEPARKIFDLLLSNIVGRLFEEYRASLIVQEPARLQLLAWATDNLEFGGRGIGSRLEEGLVNPLARALFERGVAPGDEIVVADVRREGLTFDLELR